MSYISNWYINGKIFTSTSYSMETQKFDFFFQKSSKFEFWLVLQSWIHHCFANISPTLVIDTSIERSSRVLQHGNPKIWFFFFFFQKSLKFEFWLLISRPCTFPPAHWWLILLINDFSLVIGGKLHSEYLGFSLLVANYSRNIPSFLHWRPGCRHIPYVH